MTIEIHPELKALIEQRMASGRFQSIEDLLRQSLETLPEELSKPVRQNFSQLLKESPLWRSGLTVERAQDEPRPVDL